MIWYGAVRFFVEGLRTDSLPLGALRVSQVVSFILVVAGIALYLFLQSRSKKAAVEEGEYDGLFSDYEEETDEPAEFDGDQAADTDELTALDSDQALDSEALADLTALDGVEVPVDTDIDDETAADTVADETATEGTDE